MQDNTRNSDFVVAGTLAGGLVGSCVGISMLCLPTSASLQFLAFVSTIVGGAAVGSVAGGGCAYFQDPITNALENFGSALGNFGVFSCCSGGDSANRPGQPKEVDRVETRGYEYQRRMRNGI